MVMKKVVKVKNSENKKKFIKMYKNYIKSTQSVPVHARSAHYNNKSWRRSFKISRLEAILTIVLEKDGLYRTVVTTPRA